MSFCDGLIPVSKQYEGEISFALYKATKYESLANSAPSKIHVRWVSSGLFWRFRIIDQATSAAPVNAPAAANRLPNGVDSFFFGGGELPKPAIFRLGKLVLTRGGGNSVGSGSPATRAFSTS